MLVVKRYELAVQFFLFLTNNPGSALTLLESNVLFCTILHSSCTHCIALLKLSEPAKDIDFKKLQFVCLSKRRS